MHIYGARISQNGMISGPRNHQKMKGSGLRKHHYGPVFFWPQKSSKCDYFWPKKSSIWPREPLWIRIPHYSPGPTRNRQNLPEYVWRSKRIWMKKYLIKKLDLNSSSLHILCQIVTCDKVVGHFVIDNFNFLTFILIPKGSFKRLWI